MKILSLFYPDLKVLFSRYEFIMPYVGQRPWRPKEEIGYERKRKKDD